MIVGDRLKGYHGLVTGVPEAVAPGAPPVKIRKDLPDAPAFTP